MSDLYKKLLNEQKKREASQKEEKVEEKVEEKIEDADFEEEELGQCDCGSHLKGECPECDDAEDVLAKIRKIGDQKLVNPPKAPAPDLSTARKPAETEEESEPEDKEQCPTCGKWFKHLSRHKCNKVKLEGVSSAEEVEKKLDEKKKISAPKIQIRTNAEVEIREGWFDVLFDAVVEKNGGLEVQHFSDIIGPICECVAKEHQVEWWNLIEYNKGSSYLARKFESWIDYTHPSGLIVVDSTTAECRAVKEVLKRRARNIIQGVR